MNSLRLRSCDFLCPFLSLLCAPSLLSLTSLPTWIEPLTLSFACHLNLYLVLTAYPLNHAALPDHFVPFILTPYTLPKSMPRFELGISCSVGRRSIHCARRTDTFQSRQPNYQFCKRLCLFNVLSLPFLSVLYLSSPFLSLPFLTLPYLSFHFLSLPFLPIHHVHVSLYQSGGLVFPLSYSLSYSLNWFTEPVHCSMHCPIHWLIQIPTIKSPKSYHSPNTANTSNIDHPFPFPSLRPLHRRIHCPIH